MDKIYLKKAGILDLPLIYRRYRKDFPKAERKPFKTVLKSAADGKSDILLLYSGSRRVAYTVVLTDSEYNAVLMDYLAVLPKERSHGYGSKIIQQLKKFYADKSGIIIEIEEIGKAETDEQNRQRVRRKEFYLRNGFQMQPVKLCFFGVDMHMLYLKINSYPDDFIKTAYDMYNRSLGKTVTKEKIALNRLIL